MLAALAGAVQMAQAGVNRRRLAAAARAGQKNYPVLAPHDLLELAQHIRSKAQLVQLQRTIAGLKKADDGALPLNRREPADPHIHTVTACGLPQRALSPGIHAVVAML